MSRNPECSVYIGNLDEKVSEKVLYEILMQVGRIVDLHIPRDKDTNRLKGFAFVEYETVEIANYAVKLFSGIIRLNNKLLKFAMSGQDKSSSSQSNATPVTPTPILSPIPKPYSVRSQGTLSQGTAQPLGTCRFQSGTPTISPVYAQGQFNIGTSAISPVSVRGQFNIGTPAISPVYAQASPQISSSLEYSRRLFGSMMNNVSRPGARQPVVYPSY